MSVCVCLCVYVCVFVCVCNFVTRCTHTHTILHICASIPGRLRHSYSTLMRISGMKPRLIQFIHVPLEHPDVLQPRPRLMFKLSLSASSLQGCSILGATF